MWIPKRLGRAPHLLTAGLQLVRKWEAGGSALALFASGLKRPSLTKPGQGHAMASHPPARWVPMSPAHHRDTTGLLALCARGRLPPARLRIPLTAGPGPGPGPGRPPLSAAARPSLPAPTKGPSAGGTPSAGPGATDSFPLQ